MAEHIVHDVPVPQAVYGLRALCGLPPATLRPRDGVHQIAMSSRPQDVTCVGCLAVRELAAAREELRVHRAARDSILACVDDVACLRINLLRSGADMSSEPVLALVDLANEIRDALTGAVARP